MGAVNYIPNTVCVCPGCGSNRFTHRTSKKPRYHCADCKKSFDAPHTKPKHHTAGRPIGSVLMPYFYSDKKLGD